MNYTYLADYRCKDCGSQIVVWLSRESADEMYHYAKCANMQCARGQTSHRLRHSRQPLQWYKKVSTKV